MPSWMRSYQGQGTIIGKRLHGCKNKEEVPCGRHWLCRLCGLRWSLSAGSIFNGCFLEEHAGSFEDKPICKTSSTPSCSICDCRMVLKGACCSMIIKDTIRICPPGISCLRPPAHTHAHTHTCLCFCVLHGTEIHCYAPE